MNSEKVKEIKLTLQGLIKQDVYINKFVTPNDILTYINELESENERLKEENGSLSCDLDYVNEKLTNAEIEVDDYKDRIAELEKGNEALSFAVKQGFNDCQTKTLKQFAERLKEKMYENENGYIEFLSGKNAVAVDIVDFENCLDETLKEFIDGEK